MADIYANMFAFVNNQSKYFISDVTKLVADAIQPAVVTLMGVYVILYGLAHIRGMVKEPIVEFALRMFKMIFIFAVGVGMWKHNDYIVDTFIKSPSTLAAAIAGKGTGDAASEENIRTFDKMLDDTFTVGKAFYDQGSVLSNFGAYIAAFVVWVAGVVITAYGAFLIILSKVFLSVIIALGPIFISMLLFDATSKFFEGWISQMSNYAVMTPLVTAANVFIIEMFQGVAEQTAEKGTAAVIADVFPMIVTAAVSVMVLHQIPSVASGLAGGVAVSSMGVGRKVFGAAVSPVTAPMKHYGGKAKDAAVKKLDTAVSKGSRAAWNKAKTIARPNKVDKAA